MAGVDADILMLHSTQDRIRGMLESGMSADIIFRGLKAIGFSGNKRKLMAFLENKGLWTRRSHPRTGKSIASASEALVAEQLMAGMKAGNEHSSRQGKRISWKARKPRKCVIRSFNRGRKSLRHCKDKGGFAGIKEMIARIEARISGLQKALGAEI